MFCSADDKNDVISTLAKIYGVALADICAVLCADEQEQYDWSNRPMLVWQMGQQLGCGAHLNSIDTAAYYHRTRFDGTSNWFRNGLLEPEAGAKKIVEAMRPYLSEEQYNCVSRSARNIVCSRESFAMERGPCAFDVYDYARCATQPGMDFSVPEFVADLCARNSVGAAELRSAIEQHLMPVIVKFRATPTNVDDYVAGLWCFLYRLQDTDDQMMPPHICTQPRGLVTSNDILELMQC